MNFPSIPEDFDSMDGASFDFDNFIFGTGDAEAMQSGVRTSTTIGATETAGNSSGAPSHPSSFRSNSNPPRLSRGDPILIIYSLETHAWTLHHLSVSSYLLSLLLSFLTVAFFFIV